MFMGEGGWGSSLGITNHDKAPILSFSYKPIFLHSGEKLRPVGSALSPNGLAFSSEGMVSLALLDKVLSVDQAKKTVTVQTGARVQEVPFQKTLNVFPRLIHWKRGSLTMVLGYPKGRDDSNACRQCSLTEELRLFNRPRWQYPRTQITVIQAGVLRSTPDMRMTNP